MPWTSPQVFEDLWLVFRMLENQREVCCWKRDDLGESEGGGYHVEGEGGRGGVEGGERGGEGEREGL